MGMDAISAGMLATSAFNAWQQYEAGSEADKAYRQQAEEVGRQTAYAQPAARRECPTLDGLEARSSGLTSVRDKRAQSTRRNHDIVLVNIQHDYAESERKPNYDVAQHRARASSVAPEHASAEIENER